LGQLLTTFFLPSKKNKHVIVKLIGEKTLKEEIRNSFCALCVTGITGSLIMFNEYF